MKKLYTVLTTLFLFGLTITPAFARRSGGSSYRAPSRSSYSAPKVRTPKVRPSTPPPKVNRISRSAKPKPTYRKAAPKKVVRKVSPKQQARLTQAKKNGTMYKSKKQATSAFKSKNATKYSSSYKTRPATRPSHIPKSYSSGGRSYNVTYNVNHGGYGYMGASGRWMVYDAMADAAMLTVLMNRNNYAYSAAPVSYHHQPTVHEHHRPVVQHSSNGVNGGWIFLAVIVVVFLGVISFFISNQD